MRASQCLAPYGEVRRVFKRDQFSLYIIYIFLKKPSLVLWWRRWGSWRHPEGRHARHPHAHHGDKVRRVHGRRRRRGRGIHHAGGTRRRRRRRGRGPGRQRRLDPGGQGHHSGVALHLRGSWRSCGSRLLLLPWRDGPCASARGGSRRIWGGKEAQGHTRGGTPRLSAAAALGWGGEGRLLLAWHAVRWWGAGGRGCPGDGEWRGGQDYPGVSLEVSGLNRVSPLSPMPLEGLRERYQTQEPALTSLRPSAATTERHIQPQGHSYSPRSPVPSLQSLRPQSHPSPQHASTLLPHPGLTHRLWPATGWLFTQPAASLHFWYPPYAGRFPPGPPKPLPRHNHAKHQLSSPRSPGWATRPFLFTPPAETSVSSQGVRLPM